MKVELKYGTQGLPVDLPETPGFAGVLTPLTPGALVDAAGDVASSLEHPIASRPLAELCAGRKSACVVVSDSTRPVPNPVLLGPVLRTLEGAGVPRDRTLLLIATGMHRPSTAEERERLLGTELLRAYPVLDHDSRCRDDLVEVGRIGGTVRAWVNRRYVEAEFKLLTGFIEPHAWAGYSGGRKSLLPGISSLDTLEHMHGPEMVADPRCAFGVLDGNPFHEAGLEVLALAGADFLVNVTLDPRKRITGVFSGHPVEAHRAGCRALARHCVHHVGTPLDFVVTTNAGFPLDATLYQSIKGFSAAARAVKKGGDVLSAARCAEGLGSPEFREALGRVDSPAAFLDRVRRKEFFIPDQWCVQELCKILNERGVWLYSQGFTPEEVRRLSLEPVASVEEGVGRLLAKHGAGARWAVVPDGPMVILEADEAEGAFVRP